MEATGSTENDNSREPNAVEREENVKHLEFIQAIIARLASNSFYIKGWALTIAAASFGFAVNRVDWKVATVGAIIVAGFWVLDAYYLRQERLFRHLYDSVRKTVSTTTGNRFSMDYKPFVAREKPLTVFFSITLRIYYPLLVLAGIALTIFFVLNPPAAPQAAQPPPPATSSPQSLHQIH